MSKGWWATLVVTMSMVAACSATPTGDTGVSLGTLGDTTAAPTTTTLAETTTSTEPETTSTTTTTTVTSTTTPATEAETAWDDFWVALPNPRPDGSLRGPATERVKEIVADRVFSPGISLPETVETHSRVHLDRGLVRAVVTDCILTWPPLSGDPDQSGLHLTGSLWQRDGRWVVVSVSFSKAEPHCAPGALISEPRDIWVRDLELELGLPDTLEEMESLETDETFADTTRYADELRAAGAAYQGDRELHPVVSGITRDDQGRVVVILRSCHTHSDDFGVVAGDEMLTDLYDPGLRRSDIGEVTLFEDGWRISDVRGSRRPCEPGDEAIEVVEEE